MLGGDRIETLRRHRTHLEPATPVEETAQPVVRPQPDVDALRDVPEIRVELEDLGAGVAVARIQARAHAGRMGSVGVQILDDPGVGLAGLAEVDGRSGRRHVVAQRLAIPIAEDGDVESGIEEAERGRGPGQSGADDGDGTSSGGHGNSSWWAVMDQPT